MPVVYRSKEEKREILVRLMGVQRQELPDPMGPKDQPPPQPRPPQQPQAPSPVAKYFEAKPGFANSGFTARGATA